MRQRLTRFLKNLEKVKYIPQENLLVTLEVKPLYAKITNNKGIKAVKGTMRNERKKRYLQKVIITFLSLILNLSNFKFNCKPYLQTMGCTIVQSVLLPTQTYLWQVSKQNTSLHTLKTCFCYTLDILTAYL